MGQRNGKIAHHVHMHMHSFEGRAGVQEPRRRAQRSTACDEEAGRLRT